MGGPGSGNRWRSSSATCEAYKRIDLRFLRKKGWLAHGNRYSLSWTCGDELSGNIQYTAFQNHLFLDFKCRSHGEEEWKPVQQAVYFDFTPMHLGGQRQWLTCPRCQRRCQILYGGAKLFCRKCHRLSYRSQSEDSAQRALSRAQATRKRLGGFEGIDDPFPPKPKGMHWKTYAKLEAYDNYVQDVWNAEMARLIGQLETFERLA